VISRSLKGKGINSWTARKFSSSPSSMPSWNRVRVYRPSPGLFCQDTHSDSDDDDPFIQGVEAGGTLCFKFFFSHPFWSLATNRGELDGTCEHVWNTCIVLTSNVPSFTVNDGENRGCWMSIGFYWISVDNYNRYNVRPPSYKLVYKPQ
jgi:hypothetical protein